MRLLKNILNFFTGHWYVLYTSGHGSDFRLEKGLLTKRNALDQADRWVGIADTIGGKAQVKNLFTGKIIYPARKTL